MGESRLRGVGTSFWTTETDGSNDSMSFGAITHWVAGLQISATVHCGSNPLQFRSHCRHWLQCASRCGAIALQINHDPALPARDAAGIITDEAGKAFLSWIEFLKEESLV